MAVKSHPSHDESYISTMLTVFSDQLRGGEGASGGEEAAASAAAAGGGGLCRTELYCAYCAVRRLSCHGA